MQIATGASSIRARNRIKIGNPILFKDQCREETWFDDYENGIEHLGGEIFMSVFRTGANGYSAPKRAFYLNQSGRYIAYIEYRRYNGPEEAEIYRGHQFHALQMSQSPAMVEAMI